MQLRPHPVRGVASILKSTLESRANHKWPDLNLQLARAGARAREGCGSRKGIRSCAAAGTGTGTDCSNRVSFGNCAGCRPGS